METKTVVETSYTYRLGRLHSLDLREEITKRLAEDPKDLAWALATILADRDPSEEHHWFKVETIRRRISALVVEAAEDAKTVIAGTSAEKFVTAQENGDFRDWQVRIIFEQTDSLSL